MLQPGEQVLHWAHMRRQPGLFWQIFLIGGLLLALMTKVYFAVLTNQRLILIKTKGGFWSGTPQQMNLGVEQHDVRTFKKVTTSGFANNRSMTFHSDGGKMTLRIAPWMKAVSGTAAFLEQVPNLINSGQLAHGQLPAGAPQQHYGAPQQHYGAPQQQYGAPPQQYGAPPQQAYGAPPAAFGPGSRVMVLAQDGQRYPGTVVQLQGEHCFVTMQNGQFWFPANAVSAV
jgi:hypothetical protein